MRRVAADISCKVHSESLLPFLLRCPTSAFGDKTPWHLSTAATRSARFLCHRQRSHRSPCSVSFLLPSSDTFPLRAVPRFLFPCHCEERSDVAIRSSQNDDPGSHVEKFLLHFGKNYVRIPRVSKSGLTLGCRQAVRHQTLTLAFVGSNPAIPANDPLAQ